MDIRCEIQRINAEIEYEDAIAAASEIMEIEDIIDQIKRARGDDYAESFSDGFACGYGFRLGKEFLRDESIAKKYESLNLGESSKGFESTQDRHIEVGGI